MNSTCTDMNSMKADNLEQQNVVKEKKSKKNQNFVPYLKSSFVIRV